MNRIINVAIVDDEEFSTHTLLGCLERFARENDLQFSTECYSRGDEFLADYRPRFDIVFMDIMMVGLNGMETARQLRKLDNMVSLIFVTNLAKFAVSSYEVSALDFIVKPVIYDTFAMKMKKATRVALAGTSEKIVIKSEAATKVLSISEIYLVEVYNHELIYRTANGDFRAYGSLVALTEELKKHDFVRCSSSFLVNLRYVSAIKGNSCFVGKYEVPIGRSMKKTFMEELANYLGRRI